MVSDKDRERLRAKAKRAREQAKIWREHTCPIQDQELQRQIAVLNEKAEYYEDIADDFKLQMCQKYHDLQEIMNEIKSLKQQLEDANCILNVFAETTGRFARDAPMGGRAVVTRVNRFEFNSLNADAYINKKMNLSQK
jgi:hypothetical protein